MKTVRMALMTSLACTAIVGTVAAQVTVIAPSSGSIAPLGIGVTSTKLVFSQPYCAGIQSRGVYQVTGVTPNLVGGLNASISELNSLPETGICAENYLFISPGLPGFPAGSVYVTDPSSSTTDAVYKDGVLFKDGIADAAPGHAGITFDEVGTFQHALIVTTVTAVYGFDSNANLIFTYPAPGTTLLETATVAPTTNLTCPGCLYVTSTNQSSNGSIYFVAPGGAALTKLTDTPRVEPEGILFVPPVPCTYDGFAYFVSGFAAGPQIETLQPDSGALLGYTAAEIAPLATSGQALVPFEDGYLYSFNPAGNVFTLFDVPAPVPATSPAQYQLEGASLSACAPASAHGCPATFGYWKHHPFSAATFVIGGVTYNDAELVNILNSAPKGGDATLVLMHQLVAAVANEAAGAQHVGVVEDGMSVDDAIAAAEELLQFGLPQTGYPGSNPSGAVFPLNLNNPESMWFVQSGTTLGGYFTTLSTVLNDYNSDKGLNCSEGSGLS